MENRVVGTHTHQIELDMVCIGSERARTYGLCFGCGHAAENNVQEWSATSETASRQKGRDGDGDMAHHPAGKQEYAKLSW